MGGWVSLGAGEAGESVSDGLQPDSLMVLRVVQQVWTCGGRRDGGGVLWIVSALQDWLTGESAEGKSPLSQIQAPAAAGWRRGAPLCR